MEEKPLEGLDETPAFVGVCKICGWEGPERDSPDPARSDAEEHLALTHGGLAKIVDTDPAVPGTDLMPHEKGHNP